MGGANTRENPNEKWESHRQREQCTGPRSTVDRQHPLNREDSGQATYEENAY